MKYRTGVILALLCAGMGCAAWWGSGCAAVSQPKAAVVAEREPPFVVPVVELRGDGAELGQAYGEKLSTPIHYLFDNYLKPYFRNEAQRFIALTIAGTFEGKLEPQHAAEAEALAKQVNIDPREVMLAQCFLDLSPMTACTTITLPADAAPDGVARFARNLDFPGMKVADKNTVVLIYHPNGRYAFAAVSWPGLLGVLSGMNEHGLTLANMEITRTGGLPKAMPYSMLYRTILERCKTVDEAVALLEKTPRQTANNLMLMDEAGNRAVVEITTEKIVVRRGEAGKALISTNHHRGLDQDTAGLCWRYDLLHKSAKGEFGRIGAKELEGMLGDVEQGKMTLQSMVFEPSNRVMYLATGEEAPKGTFYRLNLKRYFEASSLR